MKWLLGKIIISPEYPKKEGQVYSKITRNQNPKNLGRKNTTKTMKYFPLCSIYKKRDVMDCKNYRGIPLLCTVYILLNIRVHVIYKKRLYENVKKDLRKENLLWTKCIK